MNPSSDDAATKLHAFRFPNALPAATVTDSTPNSLSPPPRQPSHYGSSLSPRASSPANERAISERDAEQVHLSLVLEASPVPEALRTLSPWRPVRQDSQSTTERFFSVPVGHRFPEYIRRDSIDGADHGVDEEASINESEDSSQRLSSRSAEFNHDGQSASANEDAPASSSTTQHDTHQGEPGGLSPRPRLPHPTVMRKRTREFRKLKEADERQEE